ncbi:MAG TPA: hypothetical protein VHN37_05515 [Actinomycetota bacterium]|nr:hypothetical protein [Actinomycetota bacterium]
MGVYFHLMTDDIPAEQIKTHPPYVTQEEALKAAETEAAKTNRTIQIFRISRSGR